MSVTTTRYIRKPIYVDAIQITGHNIDEVADWCQGDVKWEESPGNTGMGKKYIRVRVVYPKNLRQTKAFVGDWILYTDKGYKVYTNKAFLLSFEEAVEEPQTISGGEPDDVVLGDEEINDSGITANEVLEAARGEGLQGPVFSQDGGGPVDLAEDVKDAETEDEKAA